MPTSNAGMRTYIRNLSIQAWDTLRNSEYAPPKLIDANGRRFGRRRLMLWRSAEGFHDYQPETFTVFQPFEGVPLLVRRAIWDLSEDQKSLHQFVPGKDVNGLSGPSPRIVVRDERIDSSEFERILDQATELRLPIVWPWPKDKDSLTTDVGMLGFEYFDLAEPQASIRCAWSMDLPPEWEPVTKWFGRMYEFLVGHFGEQ